MSRKEVFEQVESIIRDVFDDETLEVSETTTAEDIEEWDSLTNINLIVSVEKKFNIKFQIDEIGEMENVGALSDLIIKKMA